MFKPILYTVMLTTAVVSSSQSKAPDIRPTEIDSSTILMAPTPELGNGARMICDTLEGEGLVSLTFNGITFMIPIVCPAPKIVDPDWRKKT